MKGALLVLVAAIALWPTLSHAQSQSRRDSLRAQKAYIKAHRRYGYPVVTTVSPLQITVFDSLLGPGISIGQMRFLGPLGKYALQFSLNANFASDRLVFGERLTSDSFNVSDHVNYFATGGASWHPRGNTHVRDYFLGADVGLGYSREVQYTDYYHGHSSGKATTGHFLSAVLFSAGINFQLKRHTVLGLLAKGGPIITAGGEHGALAQFGFVLGRRY